MGNQCACQKIESEEEILSKLIGNMKIKEIETKCVYNQFLNCVDNEDMIIDYFMFSNFVQQIIGNNFYKLPQTIFFENLRKRSDYLYANIKAIGIILILFSAGDEKTKINFIIDYFFSFYGELNEKTVKEFLGYIIDSQTDNCIFSFREIYSYESIKAFKEIYSRNRRRLLISIIYENFESVKLKYFGKLILNNRHENNLHNNNKDFNNNNNSLYVFPCHKRSNKLSKYKRKTESLSNTRNSIRNKLIKGFSVYNAKKCDAAKHYRNMNLTKTCSLNSRKRVNFYMENRESLASLRKNIENCNQKFYNVNKYMEMNHATENNNLIHSLKDINKNYYNREIGIINETTQESNLKALNIKATTETNFRRLRNKKIANFQDKKLNRFLGENCLTKKVSFGNAAALSKEEIQDTNKNNNFNLIKQSSNSDEKLSAKFKSESEKSSNKILELTQNNFSEKINDKIENLIYYNKKNSKNKIPNNLNINDINRNNTNKNNETNNNNTEENEISFCEKHSSNKNNYLAAAEEADLNNENQTEKALAKNLKSITIEEKSSSTTNDNRLFTDNNEKKIYLENDKISEKLNCNNLNTSKIISVERISFNSNVNRSKINNYKYEKYSKGQCDKTLKNSNVVEQLHQKNRFCLTEENEEKKKKIRKKQPSCENIVIDPNALENEIITNPELSDTIFREFLELSFQFFNGDTIRNWLYDNFLREKLNYN